MMRPALVLLLAALLAPAAHAERIRIPVGAQGSAAAAEGLPGRGETEAAVEARFGRPVDKHPAVGQPPVERWDYPDFSVYFETGHVVHSVVHPQPLVPAN